MNLHSSRVAPRNIVKTISHPLVIHFLNYFGSIGFLDAEMKTDRVLTQ